MAVISDARLPELGRSLAALAFLAIAIGFAGCWMAQPQGRPLQHWIILACGVCLFANSGLLFWDTLLREHGGGQLMVILGMTMRLSLPLAAIVAVAMTRGVEASRTFATCLLIVYPIMLLATTCYSIKDRSGLKSWG